MQSANLISPAFVTHSDVFYSNNEVSYLFSRASFPDDSAFSAYVEIDSDRVPLAIAADPAGVLKVRAQFVMSSSRAFAAYPLPEGDRYAHACEPSPLQLVKLGVISYQNAVPGPSQEESFLVLKGGLHATDFRLEGIRYLTRQKDAQLHFLSRQPVIRKVHPQEPAGLMFLSNFTPLPLVHFCVREFRFGGTHEDRVIDELELEENQMYFIPADVKSLAIPDECFAYEVYLLDPVSGKRFSQVRMYHIDRKAHERVFIVAYENALGGYETLYFTGDDSQSEKITSSDTVDLASDPARAGRRINVEGNLEITLRTGFYSPGLEVALRELLYSPDVYLITPAGHRVPVLVTSSDLQLPGGQANPSAEITFTLDSSSPFPLHQLLHF